jgi:PadR family transcriptional regulator, regulatory protein AphA
VSQAMHMNRETQLTHTSYIVLGLLSMAGEATPYDLKQMASATVGNFWSLPHSQLYAEPARLARAGYVTEHQEDDGRRRKRYALTGKGKGALEAWLTVLTPEPYELRDLAVLKLFFGADTGDLAEVQVETHKQKLAEYEALKKQAPDTAPKGALLAGELGIRHERVTIKFWSEQVRAPKN